MPWPALPLIPVCTAILGERLLLRVLSLLRLLPSLVLDSGARSPPGVPSRMEAGSYRVVLMATLSDESEERGQAYLGRLDSLRPDFSGSLTADVILSRTDMGLLISICAVRKRGSMFLPFALTDGLYQSLSCRFFSCSIHFSLSDFLW